MQFALSKEREPRQLFFKFWFQIYRCVSGFGFAIVLTVINEANDFIVARDSKVKYKFNFSSTFSLVSPSWFRKPPNYLAPRAHP